MPFSCPGPVPPFSVPMPPFPLAAPQLGARKITDSASSVGSQATSGGIARNSSRPAQQESSSKAESKGQFMKDKSSLLNLKYDISDELTHDYYEYEQIETGIVVRGRLKDNILFCKVFISVISF